MWCDNCEVADCIIDNSPLDVILQLRQSSFKLKSIIDDLYQVRKLSKRWLIKAETFRQFIDIYNHRYRRHLLKISPRNQIIRAIVNRDVETLDNIIKKSDLPVVGGCLKDLYFLAGQSGNHDIMTIMSRLYLMDGHQFYVWGRASVGDSDYVMNILQIKPQYKSEIIYWLAKHGHGKILNSIKYESEENQLLKGLIAGNHLTEFMEFYSYCRRERIYVFIQPLVDEALKAVSSQPIKCLHKLLNFKVNAEMIKRAMSYDVMKWLISKAPKATRNFQGIIERMTLDDSIDDAIKIIYLVNDVNDYFSQVVKMAATHGAFKILKAFCEYVKFETLAEAMKLSIIKGYDYATYHLHSHVKDLETYYGYLKLNRCSPHIKRWLNEQIALM